MTTPATNIFLIKWQEYETAILTNFHFGFKLDDDVSDLWIWTRLPDNSTKLIKAHKILLLMSSLWFRERLIQDFSPEPVVHIDEIRSDDIMSILNFIYDGSAMILQDQIDNFVQTGRTLKVRGLYDEWDQATKKGAKDNTDKIQDQSKNPVRLDLCSNPVMSRSETVEMEEPNLNLPKGFGFSSEDDEVTFLQLVKSPLSFNQGYEQASHQKHTFIQIENTESGLPAMKKARLSEPFKARLPVLQKNRHSESSLVEAKSVDTVEAESQDMPKDRQAGLPDSAHSDMQLQRKVKPFEASLATFSKLSKSNEAELPMLKKMKRSELMNRKERAITSYFSPSRCTRAIEATTPVDVGTEKNRKNVNINILPKKKMTNDPASVQKKEIKMAAKKVVQLDDLNKASKVVIVNSIIDANINMINNNSVQKKSDKDTGKKKKTEERHDKNINAAEKVKTPNKNESKKPKTEKEKKEKERVVQKEMTQTETVFQNNQTEKEMKQNENQIFFQIGEQGKVTQNEKNQGKKIQNEKESTEQVKTNKEKKNKALTDPKPTADKKEKAATKGKKTKPEIQPKNINDKTDKENKTQTQAEKEKENDEEKHCRVTVTKLSKSSVEMSQPSPSQETSAAKNSKAMEKLDAHTRNKNATENSATDESNTPKDPTKNSYNGELNTLKKTEDTMKNMPNNKSYTPKVNKDTKKNSANDEFDMTAKMLSKEKSAASKANKDTEKNSANCGLKMPKAAAKNSTDHEPKEKLAAPKVNKETNKDSPNAIESEKSKMPNKPEKGHATDKSCADKKEKKVTLSTDHNNKKTRESKKKDEQPEQCGVGINTVIHPAEFEDFAMKIKEELMDKTVPQISFPSLELEQVRDVVDEINPIEPDQKIIGNEIDPKILKVGEKEQAKPDVPKDFCCSECIKTFSSSASLKRHMAYHRGETTCRVCRKVLATQSSLTSHMVKFHILAPFPDGTEKL